MVKLDILTTPDPVDVTAGKRRHTGLVSSPEAKLTEGLEDLQCLHLDLR